ncbi:MAG: universal stress protein [Flammeovirgaceae bacterium]|jgi:nucleotide-binding universal stress UspA family protein|nr:universal stress protein [Flammeovirgaceae bacterium]
MKILIPTDFSNNAGHALNYAALLGKAMNANLILLHVYTPPVTRGNVVYPLIKEEIGRIVNEATEKLQTISTALSEDYGISCEHLVRMGSAVGEIVLEAENSQPDLIVMGTLGASGLAKMVFGSNTASVIERATCPVLAVPANTTLALPKKIVFATDYEDTDIQTVKELIKITKRLKAEFILLHVSKENLRSDSDLIEDFSKAVATEVRGVQPFYYVMHHENTQEGIDHFVDAVGAHLIALSMRKRSIFKKLFSSSLSKKMVYQACLPLLVFHAVQPQSGYNDF